MLKFTFYRFARGLSLLFISIYLRSRAKGLENIPKTGGFILAVNHLSYLDPVVAGAHCHRDLCYLSRDSLFKNSLSARILQGCNCIPLKRNTADLGALKKSLQVLKNGAGLLVFPEGTRRKSDGGDQILSGVGFLARKSGVPVIPARIERTDLAMPPGARWIRPVSVKVSYGKPCLFGEREGETDAGFTRYILDRIYAID